MARASLCGWEGKKGKGACQARGERAHRIIIRRGERANAPRLRRQPLPVSPPPPVNVGACGASPHGGGRARRGCPRKRGYTAADDQRVIFFSSFGFRGGRAGMLLGLGLAVSGFARSRVFFMPQRYGAAACTGRAGCVAPKGSAGHVPARTPGYFYVYLPGLDRRRLPPRDRTMISKGQRIERHLSPPISSIPPSPFDRPRNNRQQRGHRAGQAAAARV